MFLKVNEPNNIKFTSKVHSVELFEKHNNVIVYGNVNSLTGHHVFNASLKQVLG